jgi:hypothetical protein
MPKYTRKIIKKGGSGFKRSYTSMNNLNNSNNSPKTSPKLTLNLGAANDAAKVLNDENKRKAEMKEYMNDKNESINKKKAAAIKTGNYLPIENGTTYIDQTKSAAEEVGDEWDAQRKYAKASKMGATFSPVKSHINNKNTTVFGFPNNDSPIQGSPLPVLSPPSSSKKPRTSIVKPPSYPMDLFPMSPGKGGKKHRKKTYKSYKMNKTNRNKNRKSRRNSKRNSKRNKYN